jgi:nucleoside-diphosphate-sugar epimerase
VTGLDNFNDAYDVRLKDWRWVQLEKIGGIDLHRLDLTDRPALDAFSSSGPVAGRPLTRW